jgi:hypothetical protein
VTTGVTADCGAVGAAVSGFGAAAAVAAGTAAWVMVAVRLTVRVFCVGAAGFAVATWVVRLVCFTVRFVVCVDVSLVVGAVALVSVVLGSSATG